MRPLLVLWNILISALWPLLYFYKPFRGTLSQRLGGFELQKYDPAASGLKVLINAVSAGEVNAIAPFIRELKHLRPDAQVALLTTTDSGLEMARSKLTNDVELVTFFPLIDLPFASRRFLDKLRPDLYITTEAELWPNIQAQCKRRGIRTALVNGRLYMHNKAGWRGTLVRRLLSMLDIIVCQDERQRVNFVKLGIPEERLAVSGNIKFDFEVQEWSEERLLALKEKLFANTGHPIVVAGSTHESEEELIYESGSYLGCKFIFAPRHIDRVPDLLEKFSKKGGVSVARFSQIDSGLPEWDVLIVDRYGVLIDLYRIADIVVMGGTFHAKVGGHNILEATALAKPVLVGPYTFGITTQIEMLDAANALYRSRERRREIESGRPDTSDLDEGLIRFLDFPEDAIEFGKRGHLVTLTNRGAARRAAEQVLSLLTEPTMHS